MTRTAERTNLKAMGPSELSRFARDLDEPSFRGAQLFNWLYGKGVTDFDAMTNLPSALREKLGDVAKTPLISLRTRKESTDGTIKCLFDLPSGRRIESVLIPEFDERGNASRLTVCVSSQVGCALGCSFCATGKMGFRENLTAGEIFDQVWFINEIARQEFDRRITNVVYMGMGEPLMNYEHVLKSIRILTHENSMHLSWKRFTISTVGLARRIQQLAEDDQKCYLAVSLHAPTNEKRSSIMPVNRTEKTDLGALRNALEHYYEQQERAVTYEYCMFDGFNDTPEDAKNLARITRWIPSKVNLIMYNQVAGTGFNRTPEEKLNRFVRILVDRGVTVTVRRSRGEDIDAACGQLAEEENG
jgi:23S rRNA (adenine2503-C2)-methyltransferase